MCAARWQVEASPARADQVERGARFQVGIGMRRADEKLKDAGLFMERVDWDTEKRLGREVRLGQAKLTGRRKRGGAAIAVAPDKNLSA